LNLIRVMPAKGQDAMQTSIFLARLLGPVLFVFGLAFAINRTTYTAMAVEFIASRSLVYFAGACALIGGFAVVLTHNVWTADWRILITLIGWIATIAGVVRLVFPDMVKRVGRDMFVTDRPVFISGIVWIVLGAVLSYAGYLR
jgi:hypothetical protein